MVEGLIFPPSFLLAGVGIPALSIYPFNLVVFLLDGLAMYTTGLKDICFFFYRLLR